VAHPAHAVGLSALPDQAWADEPRSMTGRRVTLVATDGSPAQVRAGRPESLLYVVAGVLLLRTARRRLGT